MPSCGEIFVVEESLLTPYHNLLAAAARTPSVRTSPACRKIVESICSSSQSSAGGNGRRRPGIICLPPAGGKSLSRQPWLYLMGTFDGYDETTLPKILKDFAITVRTNSAEEGGKFTTRTSPDWRIWPTTKTQWVVVIPMTPESGKFPVEPWMCFGDHNIPYTMEASEIEKLDAYSKERLRDFSYKLVRDHAYLTKVAIALRDHEAKYLSQKKRQYASSRKSFGLQRLTQGIKSMRFTDTTNTVSDRTSGKPSFFPKKTAASVHSRSSARVVVL
ncbi:hypothetical protein EV421DRAFT_1947500 [Armillaria borealis]|uniref:Uncharacterized protein n=1 Tax=Armillaria borealis TaxID=47425 RepID=A0AA39MCY9_9AGAR|nr:hypothetical protein EV421DRAFT_1947500 [Armillaria borealis]